MKPIDVIGIGLSPEDLTERHIKIIDRADVLVGGKRHLDYFRDHTAYKIVLTGKIGNAMEEMKRRPDENIVVLASGDPNFFGIGPFIVKSFGAENVRIHPNINIVSAAFGRMKESWSSVAVVSLHGKKSAQDLLYAVRMNEKVAVLTDPEKTPAWIAEFLLKRGLKRFRMRVCEDLGGENETIRTVSPEECASMTFSDLNLVVISRSGDPDQAKKDIYPGMPESAYIHERGLITKAEIRVLALAKLRLFPDHVLWDLGAGSGSVSIEASCYITRGRIIAVERKPERVEHIRENREKFGVENLDIVTADLSAGLSELPLPDRIFIGGGGEKAADIIEAAGSYLKRGGVMVVNVVLVNQIKGIIDSMKKSGFETEAINVQINRGKDMAAGIRLEALNPIWIITGTKV